MRYRSFGLVGQTVSAITLALGDKPDSDAQRVRLIHAALEAGINGFELRTAAAAEALGRALQAVERRMVLVMLRIGGTAPLDGEALLAAIETPLLAGRFSLLDAVVVDNPARITDDGWRTLRTAVEARRVGLLGVAGEDVDAALVRPEVTLLAAPYHLASVWADRHRLLTAVQTGRTVLGHGYHPQFGRDGAKAGEPAKRGLFGALRKPAGIERVGGYDFLRRTPGWGADEICLAFALTEPALASIVVEPITVEVLEALAATPEREMPTGLAAQIEMARFAEAS